MTHERQELSTDGVRKRELPRPRFDDETTLLSARPVVPLERISAYARSKRLIRFVFALFTAGLLGAMTAILLSNWNEVRSINIQESGAINVEAPQPQPTVTNEGTEATPPAHKEPEADEGVRRQVEHDREARERRAEEHARIREQQRETRERQREARRRQREEREETSDDLLRIGEIFEGPQRPDR